MPSQAQAELDADPDQTALRILELRAYARVQAQLAAAKKAEDQPTGALADLVREIEVDVWRARQARRRNGGR